MEQNYQFPPKSIVTKTERDFLHLHTPEKVLKMFKEGTYDAKFSSFLNITDLPSEKDNLMIQELFRKELTRSDVGQRKGLVIPKKEAEEFLPKLVEKDEKGILLRFLFLYRRNWQWFDFKYSFYKSSQSYVMTNGWSRFAKSNKLKEKDVIKFYMCRKCEENQEMYVMFDVVRNSEEEDMMEVDVKGVMLFGVLIG